MKGCSKRENGASPSVEAAMLASQAGWSRGPKERGRHTRGRIWGLPLGQREIPARKAPCEDASSAVPPETKHITRRFPFQVSTPKDREPGPEHRPCTDAQGGSTRNSHRAGTARVPHQGKGRAKCRRNGVWAHHGTLFGHKRGEILKNATTWMYLVKIMPSKITSHKYYMTSLIRST